MHQKTMKADNLFRSALLEAAGSKKEAKKNETAIKKIRTVFFSIDTGFRFLQPYLIIFLLHKQSLRPDLRRRPFPYLLYHLSYTSPIITLAITEKITGIRAKSRLNQHLRCVCFLVRLLLCRAKKNRSAKKQSAGNKTRSGTKSCWLYERGPRKTNIFSTPFRFDTPRRVQVQMKPSALLRFAN
uniref:Uncharacterized protein n=1 Tax=Phlegmariurus squarrosus TaxID=73615 RepID=H9M842_PHLSQ|nr:hypothetical protein HusqMp41 [Phlegmariurus squarrosus]AEV55749.1 hypothetical protein HusqMp41 [Phlegmariurus squarrosus]